MDGRLSIERLYTHSEQDCGRAWFGLFYTRNPNDDEAHFSSKFLKGNRLIGIDSTAGNYIYKPMRPTAELIYPYFLCLITHTMLISHLGLLILIVQPCIVYKPVEMWVNNGRTADNRAYVLITRLSDFQDCKNCASLVADAQLFIRVSSPSSTRESNRNQQCTRQVCPPATAHLWHPPYSYQALYTIIKWILFTYWSDNYSLFFKNIINC